MVPTSRTSNPGSSGSHGLAVFMATLIWSVTVCLMPWMVPARYAPSLSPFPLSATVILWAIALVTMGFAWAARHNTNRSYGILTISLLVVAAFFLIAR